MINSQRACPAHALCRV